MLKMRWVTILLVLVLFVSAVIVSTTKAGKTVLVLDAMLNGGKLQVIAPEETDDITTGSAPQGGFNEYHQKALSIDLTKIDEMLEEAPIDIPEQYYDLSIYTGNSGKVDYVYQIESYKLICEILSRDEINPDNQTLKIEPYHIYGSWFNESRLYNNSTSPKPFDIYNSLISMTNSYGFRGPFQLSSSYQEQDISKISENYLRMYGYLSSGETTKDVSAESPVLRIQTKELFGTPQPYRGIIGTEYTPVDLGYINRFKSGIVYQQSRPNPEYLPDAIYTFCRKLRTASYGKDLYTLYENKNHKENIELINSLSYPDSIKSDLIYLYCLQLNSSYLKGHSWKDNGVMTQLYSKMIDKYGTLEVHNLLGFKGWTDQSNLETFITGKEKGKGHLSKLPITNPNNLIDILGLRSEFEEYISKINTELAQTMSYGLESIANGKMIQSGVEYVIDAIYKWQKEKGYLLYDENSERLESEISSGMTLNGVPISIPWSYTEPLHTIIFHDFYCNGDTNCWAHPNQSHNGVDYNHFSKDKNKRVAPYINAFADGVIVEVRIATTNPSNNPWGNSLKIKHKFGDSEYYTRYGHMASINFTREDIGKEVKCGQVLGIEGSTGRSTGTHLHFGVSRINENGGETPIDPETIIGGKY